MNILVIEKYSYTILIPTPPFHIHEIFVQTIGQKYVLCYTMTMILIIDIQNYDHEISFKLKFKYISQTPIFLFRVNDNFLKMSNKLLTIST